MQVQVLFPAPNTHNPTHLRQVSLLAEVRIFVIFRVNLNNLQDILILQVVFLKRQAVCFMRFAYHKAAKHE
jgi:hypothetical protein